MNTDTNNEVASGTPRTDAELNKTWKGIHAAFVPMAFARELEQELAEKTNEVARLRELLERALELYCDCGRYSSNEKTRDKIRKELAQLATAPEEPCKCGYGPHWNEWNGVCSDCGRTRRPLPKQEEMPLDVIQQSLKWIEGDGKYPLDHDEMFGEVVNCIRYLRDEIQKLKQK